jgi:hypothetical protein
MESEMNRTRIKGVGEKEFKKNYHRILHIKIEKIAMEEE